MQTLNFLLVGVGGQGILLASDILAEVGMRAGHEVKKSEVHGMAQRGGSVVCHVRWGDRVYSPLAGKGEVDYLVAMELLESLRYVDFLRPEGVAIVNEQRLPPLAVTLGDAEYPDDEHIRRVLHEAAREVQIVPALATAEELGEARVANVVTLGALSTYLDLPPEDWLVAIEACVPARFVELDQRAFLAGRELVQEAAMAQA